MIEEDLRIWPYELLGDLLNESAIAMSAKEAKEAQPYKSFNDSVRSSTTVALSKRHNRPCPSELPCPRVPAVEVAERVARLGRWVDICLPSVSLNG